MRSVLKAMAIGFGATLGVAAAGTLITGVSLWSARKSLAAVYDDFWGKLEEHMEKVEED